MTMTEQLVDIFTKAFSKRLFQTIISKLSILDLYIRTWSDVKKYNFIMYCSGTYFRFRDNFIMRLSI